MTIRALRTLGALSLVAVSLAGCGKKGDPLPPLQIVPGAITDLSASLSGGQITLEFTVPVSNPDEPTVVAPQRIEIYRLVAPVGGTAPPVATVIGESEYLRSQIVVRPPDAATPTGGASPSPAPGERVTFVEPVDGASAAASWSYIAIGVIGRNRRGSTAMVTVPFATLPPPPDGVSLTHDERLLTVSWSGEGTAYRVFGADPLGTSTPVLLTPKPLSETRFTMPVEFGRERCFAVRTVLVAESTTVEGPPSPVQCVTAVDRYPPPAPTGLRVIQEGTAITLTWNPSDAPDLSGYVVLRGDASGVDMQPLVKEPVRETAFKDERAQSGATYTYSVYAVDNAPVPNVSQQSDRQVVTVR